MVLVGRAVPITVDVTQADVIGARCVQVIGTVRGRVHVWTVHFDHRRDRVPQVFTHDLMTNRRAVEAGPELADVLTAAWAAYGPRGEGADG